MTRTFTASAFLLAAGLAAGLSSQAMAWEAKPFVFPDMAYHRPSTTTQSAQAFIRTELPSGISLSQAEQKLRDAHMACVESPDHLSAACTFYTMAGGDGGSLGELWWTMRLKAGADGRLEAANFHQSRIGLAP